MVQLGVCYYPEQRRPSKWGDDARLMADLGLTTARIGEFAWAEIEPEPDRFAWDWLDRALDVLGAAGLTVMLGTPTATPPKWLVDAKPDILGWDRFGRPRRFGSRRHYCFSSPVYREETRRIVAALAERYGRHEVVSAWQTDNEYGCHDTTRSYSPAAAAAFRDWLRARYGDVASLNAAWGVSFWSQSYRDFNAVDPPNLTVTEANPSHLLDFYRFSSDQVVSYNKLQVDILRRLSPERDIYHNFMGFSSDFDHFALGGDIDVAGWDSYPLGFLDVAAFAAGDKARYMRQGHPDCAGFHHDLYRACGKGRLAVIEQQPGPVNWAPHNPAPRDGMVRLWTHEASAHGAELVSYFRWRQAPFAQEQMHAGLLRPDDAPAPAFAEARQAGEELARLAPAAAAPAEVALVFSYESRWMEEALPHAPGAGAMMTALEWHGAVRDFAHAVDIVPPGGDLSGYKLVIAPALLHVSDEAVKAFARTKAQILFGARCGSKTRDLHVPEELPPGPLQAFIPLKVARSETLPASHAEEGAFEGAPVAAHSWLDHVETELPPLAATRDGRGLLYRKGRFWFLTCTPDPAFRERVCAALLREAGLSASRLAKDVRVRRAGDQVYAFNYGPEQVSLAALAGEDPAAFVIGEADLPPGGVAVWRAPAPRRRSAGKRARKTSGDKTRRAARTRE
ncbi:MAG: beta-galactosidase [Caulobacterales bacterium]|nr:beta-galactosidase [Caulobacterales bacterium]